VSHAAGAGGTFHLDVGRHECHSPAYNPEHWWVAGLDDGVNVDDIAGRYPHHPVSFDAVGPSGVIGNLNYLRFSPAAGSVPTPFGGTAWAIPGTIQAEDFDDGGEGVAYHDDGTDNTGGQYRRPTSISRQRATTAAASTLAGIAPGEWLAYTVSVTSTGTYDLDARVGSVRRRGHPPS
jgi:hypothetical protein